MNKHKKYLKTFLIPRIIPDKEFENKELEKAIFLKEIQIGIIFKKNKFYAVGNLTKFGYDYFPFVGLFFRFITKIKKGF